MSLYNTLFGMNPLSDVLLATLGLTKDDCGRFRDCFVTEGKIAVYTRNGGGNRRCWHVDDGEGGPLCKNESYQKIVAEIYEATPEEIKLHPEWQLLNVVIGDRRLVRTGRDIEKTFYKCLHPNSVHCACPGCTIEYRLRKHPLYITDRDDCFDSTYATIYFKFPDEYADHLKCIEMDEPFDPSQRWLDLIAKLRG